MRIDPKVNPELAQQKLQTATDKRYRRRLKFRELQRRKLVREAHRIAPSIKIPATVLGLLLLVVMTFAGCGPDDHTAYRMGYSDGVRDEMQMAQMQINQLLGHRASPGGSEITTPEESDPDFIGQWMADDSSAPVPPPIMPGKFTSNWDICIYFDGKLERAHSMGACAATDAFTRDADNPDAALCIDSFHGVTWHPRADGLCWIGDEPCYGDGAGEVCTHVSGPWIEAEPAAAPPFDKKIISPWSATTGGAQR